MNTETISKEKQIITENKGLSKDFEEMIRFNGLEPNQFTPQFDIYKDFELREVIEKTNQSVQGQDLSSTTSSHSPATTTTSISANTDLEQLNQMVQALPLVNDNIRANLKFGMEIYKQLNNFDRIYIHNIINENSIESSKQKDSK